MQAQDKKEIDHNDYWYIKDNPLSKVGVFPYFGRTISPDLEPDKIYQVLRPEEELNNQDTLEQNVHIEASFPGVQDRNELEEAFNNKTVSSKVFLFI